MDRKQVLDTAIDIVTADRQQDYGPPEQNFNTIAELWSTYLRAKYPVLMPDVELQPSDTAVMLGLVKVARLATSPHKADNWIDLAGYAACGGEASGAQ